MFLAVAVVVVVKKEGRVGPGDSNLYKNCNAQMRADRIEAGFCA